MARLFTDGAELGDTSFFTNPGVRITASTANTATGTYHYRCQGGSGTGTKTFTASSEIFFRVRAYVGGGGHYFSFYSDATELFRMTYDSNSSRWNITVATTGNTPAGSFLMNTYRLIEVRYKIADASGAIEIKFDGETVYTFSGDTKPGSATTVNIVTFGISSGSTIDYDDIALNNTTGSTDNSWCGDGKVIALLPNAAGDSTQWTPSTGSNYQCVDELPPSDTDYVSASGTGFIDNYNLTSYTLSGTESVGRVWVYARAKDTLAAGTLNLGLRTNSTDYTVGKVLGTSFGLIATSGWALNPNTGVAWTQSDLDNLQSTIGMP